MANANEKQAAAKVANKKKTTVGEIITNLSLPIILVVLIVVFSILSPHFFSAMNLVNILRQNVHVAVCACAVMIIMVSGGCDLSIGYQMSVAAVLMARLMSDFGWNPILAALLGVILCAALGTMNGFLGIKLKSSTMIITLGTMAIFQGISYLISDSKTFNKIPQSFTYLGQADLFGVIPVNVIIMVVVVVLVAFVMGKTAVGRKVYAAGDNPEAARLAGLNVAKIKILSFTVAGVLVGLAAILLTARQGSANSGTGVGIEFTGITACVLSGVALKGGEGTLWKVIVAVFVLGVLSNGMQLINLGVYPQYIARGLIMLGSLYLTNRNMKGM